MSYLVLLLKLLPLVLAIIREIQRRRLTAEATDEMIADLTKSADRLVAKALLARSEVKHDQDSIASDPDNRD